MKNLWYRLFLEDRPSISLSFFRIPLAFTTWAHVFPTLCHLGDNYFKTAYKSYNANFFTIEIIQIVQKSPEWLIVAFAWLFCIVSFFFLIGLWSPISCILTTLCCYYFYALNSFHVGTLSWDILLVTLFLMCLVPYHGDYFSLDSLFRGDLDAYKRKRPFFLQRLLQLQIGFNYFYTALYKIYPEGNWISDNPIYYLMNSKVSSVVKTFLLKDYLMTKPALCYGIGISIMMIEFLMIFLLLNRRTRFSAIYLGIFFHILLILTLDVPAIFFFLFPFQFLLFINPSDIVQWIEQKRIFHLSAKRPLLLYDGNCQFCLSSLKQLEIMDLFSSFEYINFHSVPDLHILHPSLTPTMVSSQMYLIEPGGNLYGGFAAFRRICFSMPMMYPLIFIFYFPGMGVIGPLVYRLIAKNRYLLHWGVVCQNNACFRK